MKLNEKQEEAEDQYQSPEIPAQSDEKMLKSDKSQSQGRVSPE